MTSRRNFVKTVSLVSGGLLLGTAQKLSAVKHSFPAPGKRNIYIFSKHLQWLGYEEMAETAKKIGFDGIDLTVRPKGHVLPEKVKQDLPAAVKAIKNAGLLADRITTAVVKAGDKLTIDVLETASKLGITNYRMGWFDYDNTLTVQQNLELQNEELLKFEKLNKKLGLKAAYQNHAGEMVGGPVWDIGLMMQGVDPQYVGIRYDIRHATVEGGTSWPVGLRFLAPHINSFDVKDFIWKKVDGKWQPFNVPIGEGMVDFDRYFLLLKELQIEGDFTLHLEYPLGGAEHGEYKITCSPGEVTGAMSHDLNALKNWI